MANDEYDAILLVSFGGPEGREDVIPFLENVLRGRNVPRERMLEVAEHYYHFDGVSPINQQTRDVIAALRSELDAHGISLPIYWGNRNWHPMLEDTLKEMKEKGCRKAIGLVMAAYSSYSSCRQYREDIERARQAAGDDAAEVDKLRVFFNHPDFIEANVDHVRQGLDHLGDSERGNAFLVFTAHSLPKSMADNCAYEAQLLETCRLVAEQSGIAPDRYRLVYQSRSGRPQDPWLEPDVCDFLPELKKNGVKDVLILPVGFLSDHMEVLFDLDEEARQVCAELGLRMIRVKTVGTHPQFIGMLRKLIEERIRAKKPEAVGEFPPSHDVCPVDCCPAPRRR